jgi:hypothetical protein
MIYLDFLYLWLYSNGPKKDLPALGTIFKEGNSTSLNHYFNDQCHQDTRTSSPKTTESQGDERETVSHHPFLPRQGCSTNAKMFAFAVIRIIK